MPAHCCNCQHFGELDVNQFKHDKKRMKFKMVYICLKFELVFFNRRLFEIIYLSAAT